jgi:hypothetical protein
MQPKGWLLRLTRDFAGQFGYELSKKPDYKPIKVDRWWLMQLLYFDDLFQLIADVDGDIVECGVGYGQSLFKLCCLAYYEGKGRRIYGLDSFEGFPEPSEEDRSPRNPQKGEWNVATMGTIRQLLAGHGFEPEFTTSRLTLVKGFLEDSLPNLDVGSIALLHLDVDLYRSYQVALEHLWPRVAMGGVVLFDEYRQPSALEKFPGAAKAIDEFLGPLASRIEFNEQAHSYYIVKRWDML